MCKWQNYRFKIKWDQQSNPNTWLDFFLLDQPVRSILSKHKDQIKLWHFHRKWKNDDDAGHRFSFMCYANDDTGNSIMEMLSRHDTLNKLKSMSLIENVYWEEQGKENTNCKIEDTSDKTSESGWPVELQRSWPHFICGFSAMVLEMIAEIQHKTDQENPETITADSFHTFQEYYIQVNNRLFEIWHNKGSHAFFHHINAIFGGVPLIVHPRSVNGMQASF